MRRIASSFNLVVRVFRAFLLINLIVFIPMIHNRLRSGIAARLFNEKKTLFFLVFFLCLGVHCLSFRPALALETAPVLSVDQSVDKKSAATDSSAPPPVPIGYQIGPGDKVRITVVGEKELSAVYPVGGNGLLSFPLLGDINVEGLTLTDLQHKLTRLLRDGYLVNPAVSASIDEFRPIFVLGEVRRPGSYNYIDGMRYLEAAALGGGFTYRANQRKIEVIRSGYSSREPLEVSVDEFVKPGDVIIVKERFF